MPFAPQAFAQLTRHSFSRYLRNTQRRRSTDAGPVHEVKRHVLTVTQHARAAVPPAVANPRERKRRDLLKWRDRASDAVGEFVDRNFLAIQVGLSLSPLRITQRAWSAFMMDDGLRIWGSV